MKTQLEQEDIQAIAAAVIEQLKPLLSNGKRDDSSDTVFNKKTLATYLHVSEGTINRMVSQKQIPHFKIQAGQSGGVRFRQRDIDKWIARQTIPDIELKAVIK